MQFFCRQPFDFFPGATVLQWFAVSNFTVSASAKLLVAPASPAPTNVSFQVDGVPNLKYVVQCSTNSTEWINVRTNAGAPFTFSDSIALGETNRFYRTLILPAD
jgi:hypothetical protein